MTRLRLLGPAALFSGTLVMLNCTSAQPHAVVPKVAEVEATARPSKCDLQASQDWPKECYLWDEADPERVGDPGDIAWISPDSRNAGGLGGWGGAY